MKNKLITVFLVLASHLTGGSAIAAIITADADGFANGANLNNAFSGVTLSAFGTSTDGNIYAQTSAIASTGASVFGNSSSYNPLWIPGGREFQATFDLLTSFVSLDFIANDSSDSGVLSWYGVGGVLLGTQSTGALTASGQVATLMVNLGSDLISYITATGSGGDNLALDNLRFDDSVAVPEPGTLLLFVIGLAGAGFVSRRKSA